MIKNNLVLDVPPGIGLLGMAFEKEGYVVVNGPDLLWGRDMRGWHPVRGAFEGIIGGPPCQCFSKLRYLNPLAGQKHGNLIPEFERIVTEIGPDWFLMENVVDAPEPVVLGYQIKSLILNNRWVGGEQRRERRFSFGTPCGIELHPDIVIFEANLSDRTVSASSGVDRMKIAVGSKLRRGDVRRAVVLAGHGPVGRGAGYQVTMTIQEMCALQGLPTNFTDDMPFTMHGKRSAIGNGVPLPMGRAVAKAVRRATK